MYSASVVKLVENTHSSNSQMNGITSILQEHARIARLPTGHGKSPIFKCIPQYIIRSTKDYKRRKDKQHIKSSKLYLCLYF